MCSIIVAQDFSADQVSGCSDHVVIFTLDDPSSATTVAWDFGNGTSSDLINPAAVSYTSSGTYTVTAVVDGATTVSKVDYITVYETLSAEFRIDSVSPYSYSLVPTSTIDVVDNIYSFRWEITGTDVSEIQNSFAYTGNSEDGIYTMEFPDTGSYTVKLTTNNLTSTCLDSTEQDFDVVLSGDTIADKYVARNYFSPNSVGDDYYIIDPVDPSIVLSFDVYSRTGVPVFSMESPVIYWDGRKNNGVELSTGVYFFILKATQGDTDGFYSTKGFIHLFK